MSNGQTAKLSKDLQNVDPNAKVRVIIQWKNAPSDSKNQTILNLGGVLGPVLGLVKSVVCTLTGSALQTLVNDPDVVYISPDRTLAARLDNTAAAINAAGPGTRAGMEAASASP
jgi:hypothetical protein